MTFYQAYLYQDAFYIQYFQIMDKRQQNMNLNLPENEAILRTPEELSKIQIKTQQLNKFPKPDILDLISNIQQDDQKIQQINLDLDDLFAKISRLTSQVSSGSQIQYFGSQNKISTTSNADKKQEILQMIIQQKSNVQITSNQKHKQNIQIIVVPYLQIKGLGMHNFQLGKRIGDGKYGEVFTCLQKNTKSIYALKKIFKSIINEYNMIKQLIQQIQIMQKLNHPNIVKIYSDFQDQYHIFLLLQYVHGKSLQNYFHSPQSLVSKIIYQVLKAVQYLHSQMIVHRDLKPQNILYANGIIKICDFGWATSYQQQKQNILCGTTDYISPQILQKKICSGSIDLWCIGILTYQLLIGKVPFKQKQKLNHFTNILNCNTYMIDYKQISQDAKQFISGFLKKDSNERLSIQEAFQKNFIKKYLQKQDTNVCNGLSQIKQFIQ